jgi:hypothetical protein
VSDFSVHILTTDGPVVIQRIIEEDPVVSSVICLDGRAQALPISPAYEAFVRSPIGVIEKITGHPAYRMDVSARIDEGRSWQLAACIAHVAALQQGSWQGRIYATGEVDNDLVVRPVEQVLLKLASMQAALNSEAFAPDQAIVLVPKGDESIPDNINGIPVHAVGSVSEALSLAGLSWPVRTEQNPVTTPKANRGRGLAILISAAIIAALLFGAGVETVRWSALMEQGRILELEKDLNADAQSTLGNARASLYQQWRAMKKPQIQVLDISGALFTASDAEACKDPAKRQRLPLSPHFGRADAVCMVEMRAVTSDTSMNIVGRLAYWPSGLGAGSRAERVMRGSKETSGRSWTLSFDMPPQQGAALRLVVIAGDVEIHGPQPWYQDLLAAPVDSVPFIAAVQRLESLGFLVIAKDWKRD